MPSTSKKQHNFMAAIAHSPSFAKKVGVPQSVGQDFTKADKGHKFSKGGDTMASRKPFPKGLFKGTESMAEELKEAKAIKSGKITPMQYAKGEESEKVKKMATGGPTRSGPRSSMPVRIGQERVQQPVARPAPMPAPRPTPMPMPAPQVATATPSGPMPMAARQGTPPQVAPSAMMKRGGKTKAKMAKGGGVESKGKTKGTVVKMAKGGGIESKGKTRGRMC